MGTIFLNLGHIYSTKGDHDIALDYFTRSHEIAEEIGDKSGIGYTLLGFGDVYLNNGYYEKALDKYIRSVEIFEELSDKSMMGHSLSSLGNIYATKGDYEKALDYLEKSLALQKEIGLGGELPLWTNTNLYLAYKHLGKNYDVKEIHSLIKAAENIEFKLNLLLYELLEDKSYLETAYNQVQEKASAMDEELGKKFLSYPIPKAIVEEWEKVK